MNDLYDLNRFVAAQDTDGIYDLAQEGLRRGRKTGHWMWFVFPQIAGLGHSPMSQKFSLSSLEEAKAYLQHPVLGPRLIECTEVVAESSGRTAELIFGAVDAQKLQSSMTLFTRASPDEPHFREVLQLYFDGQPDPATDRLLIA